MNFYEYNGIFISYGNDVHKDDKYILACFIINNLIYAGNDMTNFKLKMYKKFTEITPSNKHWENNKNRLKLLIPHGSFEKKGFIYTIKLRLQYLSENWNGDRTGFITEIRTNYIDILKVD